MKTLLVALLLLVVGTGTASAECAWVLWPKSLGGDFIQGLLVYDTRQQCESSQKDFIKRWDPKEQEQWAGVGAGRAHPSHWQCLPDTMDPRGPKGK